MTTDWRVGPGCVEIRHADYDGWPQGMAIKYVGPFANYDEYSAWKKREYGFESGLHFSWHTLEAPNLNIKERP